MNGSKNEMDATINRSLKNLGDWAASSMAVGEAGEGVGTWAVKKALESSRLPRAVDLDFVPLVRLDHKIASKISRGSTFATNTKIMPPKADFAPLRLRVIGAIEDFRTNYESAVARIASAQAEVMRLSLMGGFLDRVKYPPSLPPVAATSIHGIHLATFGSQFSSGSTSCFRGHLVEDEFFDADVSVFVKDDAGNMSIGVLETLVAVCHGEGCGGRMVEVVPPPSRRTNGESSA